LSAWQPEASSAITLFNVLKQEAFDEHRTT